MGKTAKKVLITGIIMIVSSGILYISGSFSTLATMLLTSGLVCSVIGTPYVNGIEYPKIQEEQQLKYQEQLCIKRNYIKNNQKFKCKDVPCDLDKAEVYLADTGLLPKEETWDDIIYTDEQTDSLQNEISGPRLVKKLTPSEKRK